MRTAWTWITPPSGSPVTVDKFRWHARIDGDEDARLAELLEAATMMCQRYSGRAIQPQVIQYNVYEWPFISFVEGLDLSVYTDEWIELPFGPINEILSVKTIDIDNVSKNVKYKFDDKQDPWRVYPLNCTGTISIEYKSGGLDEYTTNEIEQAILHIAARLYEHRGDCDNIATIELSGAKSILDSLRRSW